MPPSRRSRSSHSSRSRSSSSHSSRSHYRSSKKSNYIIRPTKNQPKDCPNDIYKRRKIFNCATHNYTYFDETWIDKDGKQYSPGYYDENGTYYDKIIFKKDNVNSILFKCEYCDNITILKWTEGSIPNCDKCGAQMEIENITTDTLYQEETANNRRMKIVSLSWFIFLFILPFAFSLFGLVITFIGGIIGFIVEKPNVTINGQNYSENEISNVDIFGSEIYLDLIDEENNTYVICGEDDDYEKYLSYDYGLDCYYDVETDCYAVYNTDVSPNLWQYWYEGTSNDYDTGWMECEDILWYIESAPGCWDPIDTESHFWHIENRFDE